MVRYGVQTDVKSLALAVYALKRCEFRYGKFVLITGLDEVSFLCGQVARNTGAAAVVFCAANEEDENFIKEQGFMAFRTDTDDIRMLIADVTDARKFDIVIEATGETVMYDLLVKAAKRGACVAAMKAPSAPYYFHVCDVIRDQIHFMGITSYDAQSLQTAERMLAM